MPVIFLTTTSGSTQTWSVPSDWNSANNKIECIGGGGGGATIIAANAPGGGGGAYATKSNVTLTPGGTTSFQIGTAAATAANGTDTWFISATDVLAKAGTAGNGTTGAFGVGGAAASCIPSTGAFSGGNGGDDTLANNGGSGGGGAGGLNGNGANGGAGAALSNGGSGGGGNGNGGTGVAASGDNGQNGGTAYDATAGGLGSAAGTSPSAGGNGSHGSGGGGGGASSSASASGAGGNGGLGTEWDSTHGSGGGGGGGGGRFSGGTGAGGAGGNGGLYGGGGGGGGFGAGGFGAGGTGGQGIIVITYSPILSWFPAVAPEKTLRLTHKGGSMLTGVITPQSAAVFNYRSIYPDRTALPERKYYTTPNTPFIVPTTPTATSIPWLPTFDDINPAKAPTSQGWFVLSTNEATATTFPQWLATYSDIVPNLTKKPNVGAVTFNPYAIAPATYQVLATYPDKLLAVPTIFPAGYISNPTPQIVTVTALNWLPTFIDKTTPLPLQINQGWYAKVTGAGSTSFPAWLGSYPDKGPRITSGWPTGASLLSTNEATATTFPQWLSLYPGKVPTRSISVNTGLFVNNSPSTVVVNVFPSWLPVYPGSTRQNSAQQADYISNVLNGVAPTAATQTGGHFIPYTHKEIEDHKRQLRKEERELEVREQEKINQANEIRRLLQQAISPELPLTGEAQSSKKQAPVYDPMPALQARLDAILAELEPIRQQMIINKLEAQRQQDEEDMEVIIRLMSIDPSILQYR